MQKLKKKQNLKKMLHFDKFQKPSRWKLGARSGENRTFVSPELTLSLGSDRSS